ncbi:pyridoxal 5'-phosphate synthase glutaminase subunit PdxT [Alkaliphilus peptidifermentans]|uniref:Pyridoxal 5'-phosphate synthase subunit PdxT n=1 Tax=Alkaliphilus peptidifermentans DSM 18978 TaxID=1120976 RepID=A0A1G5GGY8_9FIRM|nr:pyridoxal 5'-phosphate synthase glutaminase subunit PdxT [Alkaliphilus peptidifermentans]SCY50764.1 pyridoxal phosphate synthase yaaE subunit [Alkaliphilus peptidifermentans DSM 18978]
MRVGVLGMQGAFVEHVNALEKLKVQAEIVKHEKELDEIHGLIIPGGESTSIGKLLDASNLKEKLKSKIIEGLPVWGTCAGMIVIARKIKNTNKTYIPLMDIEVIRNGYGRQLASFITNETMKGIENGGFPMVFIRAPYIDGVGKNVNILAKVDGRIVAAREKNMMVTSFHPELSEDLRIHKYFLRIIKDKYDC